MPWVLSVPRCYSGLASFFFYKSVVVFLCPCEISRNGSETLRADTSQMSARRGAKCCALCVGAMLFVLWQQSARRTMLIFRSMNVYSTSACVWRVCFCCNCLSCHNLDPSTFAFGPRAPESASMPSATEVVQLLSNSEQHVPLMVVGGLCARGVLDGHQVNGNHEEEQCATRSWFDRVHRPRKKTHLFQDCRREAPGGASGEPIPRRLCCGAVGPLAVQHKRAEEPSEIRVVRPRAETRRTACEACSENQTLEPTESSLMQSRHLRRVSVSWRRRAQEHKNNTGPRNCYNFRSEEEPPTPHSPTPQRLKARLGHVRTRERWRR